MQNGLVELEGLPNLLASCPNDDAKAEFVKHYYYGGPLEPQYAMALAFDGYGKKWVSIDLLLTVTDQVTCSLVNSSILKAQLLNGKRYSQTDALNIQLLICSTVDDAFKFIDTSELFNGWCEDERADTILAEYVPAKDYLSAADNNGIHNTYPEFDRIDLPARYQELQAIKILHSKFTDKVNAEAMLHTYYLVYCHC